MTATTAKIQTIEQPDKRGCAPACIAMILGREYAEIKKHFVTNFEKQGINHDEAVDFIIDQGYQVVERKLISWHTRESGISEMFKPFASVHLLEAKPWPDDKTWHALVMDGEGKLYDPAGHTDEELRETLWFVQRVTGFWKVTDIIQEVNMPLTKKGKKIKSSMTKTYGKEKGEQVFYASQNKGKIKGVEKKSGTKKKGGKKK